MANKRMREISLNVYHDMTGKYYRHFKGNIYRVLYIAKHSETLEDIVVYNSNFFTIRQTTLTKKCGIFRQSVCDFEVLCLFTVHFSNKTAIFSSKSQSRMVLTTNSDL